MTCICMQNSKATDDEGPPIPERPSSPRLHSSAYKQAKLVASSSGNVELHVPSEEEVYCVHNIKLFCSMVSSKIKAFQIHVFDVLQFTLEHTAMCLIPYKALQSMVAMVICSCVNCLLYCSAVLLDLQY